PARFPHESRPPGGPTATRGARHQSRPRRRRCDSCSSTHLRPDGTARLTEVLRPIAQTCPDPSSPPVPPLVPITVRSIRPAAEQPRSAMISSDIKSPARRPSSRQRIRSDHMKRRTLDLLVSIGGLLLAGLLLVAGIVLTSNANFANNYVAEQLGQQNITFPPVEELSDEERQQECLVQYAGQKLTTGKQAECYANNYIGLHLKSTANGMTYAELG